jgi:hypothetical protein
MMCAAPGERQYSVASSFGLRSDLRQSGGRFAAAVFGTPEGVPLGKTDRALRDARSCDQTARVGHPAINLAAERAAAIAKDICEERRLWGNQSIASIASPTAPKTPGTITPKTSQSSSPLNQDILVGFSELESLSTVRGEFFW